MTYEADLEREPWRFDFYAVLRRLERSFPDRPRIGDSASRRDEFVALGEDPYLDFPASNLSKAGRDAQGRLRVLAKFLGLLGPQGALPLATTEEAYAWLLTRDDAFPRFLDILNHRFLQLFFRAWADARPIAQHDRPNADRFEAYLGSMVGIGSPPYRGLDSIADIRKLAYAGLMGPQAKSASRLKSLISGLFNVETEVEEFVGSWLAFEQGERTRLGSTYSVLGVDALVGGSVYSVQDKIRVRIFARDLAQYQRFLPTGDLSEPLADSVFLYIGDQVDWDVELVLPASAVKPVELSRFGQLGWTSWVAPKWTHEVRAMRSDARFHVAERVGRRRKPVS